MSLFASKFFTIRSLSPAWLPGMDPPTHHHCCAAGMGILLYSSDDRRAVWRVYAGVKHDNEPDYHHVEQTTSGNPPRSHLCRPVAYSFFFRVGAVGRRREVVRGRPGLVVWTPSGSDDTVFFFCFFFQICNPRRSF
jgi:hypothetical protein